MGFVGAMATRGAPLAGVGCDGVGFGIAAEGDEDAADCPAVGGDVEGWADEAEADETGADGTAGAGVVGLRGVADTPAVAGEGVDTEAAADSLADADADVGAGTDAVANADADAGAGTDAVANADADAGAGTDAVAAAEADAADGVDAAAGADAGFDAGGDVVADEAAGAGTGASADANIDASIIGASHVPEYAESTGAVAHEPVASMSNTAAGGRAAGSSGGGDLAIAAREPVVAMSVAVGSRAFREPLVLLEASAEVAAMPLRMPLGESDASRVEAWRTAPDESDAEAPAVLRMPLGESGAPEVGAWRAPLGESGAEAPAVLRMPLGESDAPEVGAWRAPLGESGAEAPAALRIPLGESDAPVGPWRTPLDESGPVATGIGRAPLGESGAPPSVGLFLTPVDTAADDVGAAGLWPTLDESAGLTAGGLTHPGSAPVAAALLGVPMPGARGAAPAVPGGGLVELTGVRLGGALAPVGLAPGPLAGGIPKPAGDAACWESWGESDFWGAAALAGAADKGAFGALADAGSAVPCNGFTSLAADSAPEVAPFSGSSVNSNSSNPSKSSESDSKGDFSVNAANAPVIPAASASLNASANRSGSSAPSRLSGLIMSSTN